MARRPRSPTSKDLHAFLQAAHDANVPAVRAWLADGIDPDSTDSAGWSALMNACHASDPADPLRTEVVQILLDAGANARYSTPWPFPPFTALDAAVQRRNHAVITLLVAHGADPRPFLQDPARKVSDARLREHLMGLKVSYERDVLRAALAGTDTTSPPPHRARL